MDLFRRNNSFKVLIALIGLSLISPWNLVNGMNASFAPTFLNYRSECPIHPSSKKISQISFVRIQQLLSSRETTLIGRKISCSYLISDYCTRISMVRLRVTKERYSFPFIPFFRFIPMAEEENLPVLV